MTAGYYRFPTIHNDTAVFTCEDTAHADRLLTKLRADFTWDDRLGLRPLVLPGGVSAWVLERSGVLVLAESW